MASLFLIRHGQVTGPAALYGATDVAPTDAGVAAVLNTLKHLHAAAPLDALVSSPKQRCALPARAFAKSHQLPFSLVEDLAEFDFGAWDGVAFDDFDRVFAGAYDGWPRLTDFYANPDAVTPPVGAVNSGESIAHFCARTQRALHALAHTAESQNYRRIAVVCHGGTVRAATAATGVPRDAAWAALKVPHASCYQLDINHNGWQPDISPAGWRLESLDMDAQLSDFSKPNE